jgi:hypothetical protein
MILSQTALALIGLLLAGWTFGAGWAVLGARRRERRAEANQRLARRLTRMIDEAPARPLLVRSDGRIEADKCFGLLIEALPDVSEEKKFILTDNLERLNSLTQYFSGKATGGEPAKDVMDLLDDIYPGEQWIESAEYALVYRCSCHREGYLEKMVQLARVNIEDLFGDLQEIEVRCGYCSNAFHYARSEIEGTDDRGARQDQHRQLLEALDQRVSDRAAAPQMPQPERIVAVDQDASVVAALSHL